MSNGQLPLPGMDIEERLQHNSVQVEMEKLIEENRLLKDTIAVLKARLKNEELNDIDDGK